MQKSWYQSKAIWLAIAQGVFGLVIALQTAHPDVGTLLIVKSVLDVLIRALTTEPII